MEQTTHRTLFPTQPAWNSGAALGFIIGMVCGMAAPADFFWFPALQPYHSAWISAVIMRSLLGAIFGGAIGLFAGARHHNRR
jgi:hypothetical protein